LRDDSELQAYLSSLDPISYISRLNAGDLAYLNAYLTEHKLKTPTNINPKPKCDYK